MSYNRIAGTSERDTWLDKSGHGYSLRPVRSIQHHSSRKKSCVNLFHVSFPSVVSRSGTKRLLICVLLLFLSVSSSSSSSSSLSSLSSRATRTRMRMRMMVMMAYFLISSIFDLFLLLLPRSNHNTGRISFHRVDRDRLNTMGVILIEESEEQEENTAAQLRYGHNSL